MLAKLLGIGFCSCALLTMPMAATAATIVDFTIVIDQLDSAYTSTTTNIGSVTYDETALTGIGEETLTVDHATVAFLFDGQFYDQTSDASYPSFPEFYFTDGEFVGLNLEASLTSASASVGSYILFDHLSVDYSFDGTGEFGAHMELTGDLVPEPTSVSLLLGGMAWMIMFKKRSS